MSEFGKYEHPLSKAGHNPLWCGGDMAGECEGDDPCWSCIYDLHFMALKYALEQKQKDEESKPLPEGSQLC